MVECPKCNTDIDHLKVYETAQRTTVMKVDEEGYSEYGVWTPLDWVDLTDFECPECNQTLFTDDEGSAIKFLVGDKQ